MLKRTHKSQSSLMKSLKGSSSISEQILPDNQRRLSLEAMASICDLNLGDQSNRRALGLLPMPENRQQHEVTNTNTLVIQKLLLSIESRNTSCCIKVFSSENKSRSAMLIYRGRLIGAMFGAKDISEQLYQRPAFDRALHELLAPQNIIDCHPLSDEIVLAAAAIFHGGLNSVSFGLDPLRAFKNCADMVQDKKLTGTIVCKGSDESNICTCYIYEGVIIGVYSFSEGWQTNTQTAVLNALESFPEAEIWLSVLPVAVSAADKITQSLTGLDFTAPDASE